ncbi:AAA family ATPase [Streptomyces sp. NPDC056632]|uniref:AAA family ATPase n=1 Tax=Streptomyces sp. NPDC056632 TaxID=3345884 RepID=UPI0036A5EDFA
MNNPDAEQTRALPYDAEAERAVLAGMIHNPGEIPTVVEILHGGEFYKPAHETIFRATVQLAAAGERVDPITLVDALRRSGDLTRVGGPSALFDLANVPYAVGRPQDYAEIVRQVSLRRRIVQATQRAERAAQSGEGDITAVLDRLREDIGDAATGTSGGPANRRLQQLREALVDSDTLDTIPDPIPLIDGVLFRDSLAWLYGKPGSGKSFVALDWSGCVANGLPWNFRATAQGSVLYLVAEGVSGMRKRVRGWEQAFNLPMKNVTFLPIAVQLLNDTDRRALVELVAELQPALIIIDTQARVTVGADENSNGEMSRVVDAADLLRQASGACVLLVHHAGKNGLDMRGASAFEGAATSIIKVTRDGEYIEVHSDKQKDVEDFDTIFLRMSSASDSIVLTPRTAHPGAVETSRTEGTVLSALRDSFGTSSATGPQLFEVAGVPKSSFYRALNSLVSRGAVLNIGTKSRPRYAMPGNAECATVPHIPTQSHETAQ